MGYDFKWGILWQFRELLWEGFKLTLELSIISLVLSFILGTIIGAGRLSQRFIIRAFCTCYVEFFRNIPLIVLMFLYYFAVGLYSFSAAVVGLTTFTAAFIAEIVRSGIQSVPRGNFEAAKSTGLSSTQILLYVVLPHAIMITIPPLSTEFLNVVKNSSIAMTIAVTELTFQTQELNALTFRGFEAATGVTLIYLSITLVVIGLMKVVEKKVAIHKRVG